MNDYTITPDDAFGLALIAKLPKENKDLVESIGSPHARRVAENLVNPRKHNNMPEVCEAAAALRKWANPK